MKPNGTEVVLSAKDMLAAASLDSEAGPLPEAAIGSPADNISDKEEGERVYGETCAGCGSIRLRRNGTCKVCEECGATTGCS